MIGEEKLRISRKLNFFMDEKVRVHIKRVDGYFWNGLILSKMSEDVYIFQDRKLGQVYLFVSDVREVEEFQGGLDEP